MKICDRCDREDAVSLRMDKTIVAKNKSNIVWNDFAEKEVCPKCFLEIFNAVSALLVDLFSKPS
jgi:hypothetical protein